jgi:hypothetical protein
MLVTTTLLLVGENPLIRHDSNDAPGWWRKAGFAIRIT